MDIETFGLTPVDVHVLVIVGLFTIDVILQLYRFKLTLDWTYLGKTIPMLYFIGLYLWAISARGTGPATTILGGWLRDGLVLTALVGIVYNGVRIWEHYWRRRHGL